MEDFYTGSLREQTREALKGKYGAKTRIAKLCSTTRQTVDRVLRGEFENDRVLQAAADEAIRLMGVKEETKKKMRRVAELA